jgi:molecular chaperone GrpE
MKDDKKHVDEQEVETKEIENSTEIDSSAQAAVKEEKPAEIDYKDKYIRLLSEFTQYQKQKEEEVKSMAVYGNKSLLLKMIDLLDDMESGLMQEGLGEETKSLLEMLKSKFENTMQIEGVKEIPVKVGDSYNPQTCEVLSAVEDDQNKGKVIHIARKGYLLSDRVLRTAKVIVGK